MLFGHQNDDNKPHDNIINDVTAPASSGVNPLALDPDSGVSLPVAPEALEHDGSPAPSVLDQPYDTAAGADTAPVDASQSDNGNDMPETAAVPARDDILVPAADDDLLALKQHALQQLSPLVSHLDQSPEEKFRTTMMMIQSSDNQSLIKDAYEAAQAISDDKVRAQALLDIVNEINYFTQNSDK